MPTRNPDTAWIREGPSIDWKNSEVAKKFEY